MDGDESRVPIDDGRDRVWVCAWCECGDGAMARGIADDDGGGRHLGWRSPGVWRCAGVKRYAEVRGYAGVQRGVVCERGVMEGCGCVAFGVVWVCIGDAETRRAGQRRRAQEEQRGRGRAMTSRAATGGIER